MRPIALLTALLLVLAGEMPVRAGPGLPRLASLQVGPHPVTIYVDSATARTGPNVFTLEMMQVSPEGTVSLRLLGPGGQVVPVQLQSVKILAAAGGGHGEDTSHAGADPSGHGAVADTDRGVVFRGSGRLTAPGTWQVELAMVGHDGNTLKGTAPFEVVYGGPNRAYLGATGLIMGGSLLYGVIRRRGR